MHPEPVAVVVAGSFMMDLVVRTPRRPTKGETVQGESFGQFCGGKGFNQAVAAARAGARVAMVGRLGADAFGQAFREALRSESIADHVLTDEAAGTGAATIVIDGEGDNSIVIVPRANWRLTPADMEGAAGVIGQAKVLVLQREIPPEASLAAARIARRAGARVILNPAPSGPLPPELISLADYLVPNEIEAADLTGIGTQTEDGALAAARALKQMGAGTVVMTLGARGCLVLTAERTYRVHPFPVQPVDTTGAGDAFIGSLAAALAAGLGLEEALQRANAAGALATTRMGAMPSMPTRAEVEQLLKGAAPA